MMASRPLLITGATGTLGNAFARICDERGITYALTDRSALDISSPASVSAVMRACNPWAVVNTAGYVRVDDAEHDQARCMRENAIGPEVLADCLAATGIPLVTFSSDLVFDGTKPAPYVESDESAPLNVYGRSKAMAETAVLSAHPEALVIRTSAFFGPWDQHNFAEGCRRALVEGRKFMAPSDMVVSPTYVPDLVHATLDLLIDGERGIWHLANRGAASWHDFAQMVSAACGLEGQSVSACSATDIWPIAPRPSTVVMGSERGSLMPSLEDAVFRFALAKRAEEPMAATSR